MIIDVHCHVLPEVDDGAKDGKTTKIMLKLAARQGIDAVIATPHFVCGMDEEHIMEVQEIYHAVRKWWKAKDPKKELYLGNELYYGEGIVDALEQGLAMTMNGTKYVLVEFPEYESFGAIQKAASHLLYAGYLPIIAHVERYEHMQKRDNVQELVDMGAYIQVNVAALMGKQGFWRKRYVTGLAKHGLVHFVGTDAHDLGHRRPEMKECKKYLEKKLGTKMAHQILEENPERMLKGEELE